MAEEEEQRPIVVKKIKKVEAGHHGGAWKVAYADFVTAMMALFIVLWILSASEETQLKIEAYFDDPGAFNFVTGRRTSPLKSGLEPEAGRKIGQKVGDGGGDIEDNNLENMSQTAYEKLLEKALQDSIATAEKLREMGREIEDYIEGLTSEDSSFEEFKNSIQITYTDEGIKIDLIENKESLFFEVGSSKLREKGKKIISVLTQKISKMPNSVEIQGHTDSRKYNGNSNDYNNWDLSTDRANSVRKFMDSKGLWKGQISMVSGHADKNLIKPDNPFANENRRVTLFIKYVKSKEFLDKELSKLADEN